jgi:AmiR/NasT family two-component response regulator
VDQAPALRVMLGDLAPIMAIGLRAVLEEDGIDVIGLEREPERIVIQAERLQPDVVVLDLDKDGARALGGRIQHVAPRSKVILWARDETVMEVLESVSRTPRLVAITVPEGLRNELSSNRHRDQVEE